MRKGKGNLEEEEVEEEKKSTKRAAAAEEGVGVEGWREKRRAKQVLVVGAKELWFRGQQWKEWDNGTDTEQKCTVQAKIFSFDA